MQRTPFLFLFLFLFPSHAQTQDWSSALEATERRLAEDPDNTRLLRMKASALYRLERFDEMEAVYVDLYRLQPDDPDIGLGYAQILLHNNEVEKAQSVFDDLLARHPDDRRIYEMLARVNLRALNYPGALQALQTMRHRFPEDAELLERIALMQEDLERWDEATASYDTLAALTGDPIVAGRARARILTDRDSVRAAADLYERMLEDAPDRADLLGPLAEIQVELHEWKAARSTLNTWLKLDSTAHALTLMGRTHEALGMPHEAAVAYEEAIGRDDSRARAHLGLARIALVDEDADVAFSHLDDALRSAIAGIADEQQSLRRLMTDPDGQSPIRRRAARLEAYDDVLNEAVAILSYDVDSGRSRALLDDLLADYPWIPDLHLALALLARRSGSADDAIAHLRQAAALSDENVDIRLDLGDVYESEGRLAEAARAYERARSLDETDPRAYKRLIHLYREMGRLEALIQRWEARQRSAPNHVLDEHLREAKHKLSRREDE